MAIRLYLISWQFGKQQCRFGRDGELRDTKRKSRRRRYRRARLVNFNINFQQWRADVMVYIRRRAHMATHATWRVPAGRFLRLTTTLGLRRSSITGTKYRVIFCSRSLTRGTRSIWGYNWVAKVATSWVLRLGETRTYNFTDWGQRCQRLVMVHVVRGKVDVVQQHGVIVPRHLDGLVILRIHEVGFSC